MSDVTECIISEGGGLTGYWRQRAGSWGRQAMLSDLLKKEKLQLILLFARASEGWGGGGFCHLSLALNSCWVMARVGHTGSVTGTQMMDMSVLDPTPLCYPTIGFSAGKSGLSKARL